MTDRELLFAVYSAIETMYFEMTGECLKVQVPLENGGYRFIQSPAGSKSLCSLSDNVE